MSRTINYNPGTSVKNLYMQCIIRTLVACFIAFMIYISLTIITVGTATKEIGYTILYSEDGENFTEVYTHYFEDGEDEKYADYDGKERYYKTSIRSEIGDKTNSFIKWFSQVIALIVWGSMIYGVMWKAGDTSIDMTEPDNKQIILKGLKTGLLADIPFAASYLILVITSLFKILPAYPRVHKILTFYMFAFNDALIKGTVNGFEITFWGILGAVVVLIPLPILCAFAYYMGKKHIIIKEKLIYKKED